MPEIDPMAALPAPPAPTAVPAPAGYDGAYRFFRSGDQLWKARLVLRGAPLALPDPDIVTAPNAFAITITVSPCDADGKAMREDGAPVVIDSHTHTFTETEMGEPDFDPGARALSIVAERIAAGSARVSGASAITSLAHGWA